MPALRGPLAVIAVAFAWSAAAPALAPGIADSSAPSPRIRLADKVETVFDWKREACEAAQIPDLPARAFRDFRGRTQLLLSDYENFRMIGASLAHLRPDCRSVLRSPENGFPERFEDRQWLASVFTTDGRDIWALVHDEYQGNRHPGRCPEKAYQPCWYNAVTLAHSSDGGRSYSHERAPGQLVAAPSRTYEAGAGPSGVFTPSNIIRGPDGALYVLVRVRLPGGPRGVCLLRTTDVGNAGAWRAWDGHAFAGVFTDPYRSPSATAPCALIDPGLIAEMTDSLTYNVALHRYLLVGLAPPGPLSVGPQVEGIYFSTSSDLVHWTARKLVARAVTTHSYLCGGPAPIAYPSVLDPASRSRTYATSGRHPFLYFTQFHYTGCRQTADRDLMRVRLEISP